MNDDAPVLVVIWLITLFGVLGLWRRVDWTTFPRTFAEWVGWVCAFALVAIGVACLPRARLIRRRHRRGFHQHTINTPDGES